MQHVSIDLQKVLLLQHLNFCNFTLCMPPWLGCPAGAPFAPPLHATVLGITLF